MMHGRKSIKLANGVDFIRCGYFTFSITRKKPARVCEITVSNGVAKPYLSLKLDYRRKWTFLNAAGAIPSSFALTLHRHATTVAPSFVKS
jgi:hypothetical protein